MRLTTGINDKYYGDRDHQLKQATYESCGPASQKAASQTASQSGETNNSTGFEIS